MDKLTVALLGDAFPPLIDGVANTLKNYAQVIEKEFGNTIVITPECPGSDDTEFDFPVLRYPSIDMRKQIGYPVGVPMDSAISERLSRENIDIVHCHCPMASLFLARMLRASVNAPVILTYHTKYDDDIRRTIPGKTLQDSAIKFLVENIEASDEIWTVSDGAGQNLRSLGFKGDYHVMPNGVDMEKGKSTPEKVQEVTAHLNIPENVPVFLFVGRMIWYKNQRMMFDAMRILKAFGRDFRLIMIGSGSDLEEMMAYVKENGLSDKVFFTGSLQNREELRAYYTRADLFLFPSTFDTNGLVVREAAACSVPSVLVKGSCAAEDTRDNENAFLIDETAESLAARLFYLIQDIPLIRQVGINAGNELYFSWNDAVRNAYEQYQIVSERYKAGKYPRKHRPTDQFFKVNGEVMEALGKLQVMTSKEAIIDKIESLKNTGGRE